MFPIVVDIHEPDAVSLVLSKSCKVIRANNEPKGLADYWWNNAIINMWERKKAGELISCIGARLDTQLLKYKTIHPDAVIGILQEGFITPTADGLCQLWVKRINKKANKYAWATGRISPMKYLAYKSYIYSRIMEGFLFIQTEDEWDTAITLGSLLSNSMSELHNGLNVYRTIKQAPNGSDKSYINKLLSDRGIGVKLAEKLVVEYGLTPWEIYQQHFTDLADLVGERSATIIFQGIGKDIK